MVLNQILKIKDLIRDEKLYPRNKLDPIMVYKYTQSFRAGAKFPPVTVALYRKQYYLLDGWHRVSAFEANKEKYIQTEILTGLDRDKMYVEAVKRNIIHGHALTSNEITRAITRMREMQISPAEISKIVSIPMDKVEPFVAKRITNTATGEVVFLKRGVHNLNRTTLTDEEVADVNTLSGMSQNALLSDLITITKNGLLDVSNTNTMRQVRTLYTLLEGIILEQQVIKNSKKKARK